MRTKATRKFFFYIIIFLFLRMTNTKRRGLAKFWRKRRDGSDGGRRREGEKRLNINCGDSDFVVSKLANCDAPKPGGPLTTRQPAEYKWMSGYPTPLQKIGQSLLCTGSSTQIQYLYIPVPNINHMIQYK